MSNNENNTAKQTEEILHSKGVSSIAQQERTSLQKFMDSSLAFVIVLEALIIIFFGVLSPKGTFLSVNNLFNIALNSSQMIILAVGLTYIIASGHMDLSVGMNLIFSSIVAAKVFKAVAGSPLEVASGLYPNLGTGILAGILCAILIGMVGGALNAFSISNLKLPPFIATLASMYIFQGIAMVICNGAQEVNLPRAFQTYFGHAKLFGYIPYQVIAAVIIGVVLHLVMKYTRFGLHVRATGSNRESARRAGINVTLITFQVYLLTGALAAVAGCFDIARFATTNPSGHQTDGMMAIMAAVMGGTSMKGGIASVLGAMLATLIPVSLSIGMVVLGINSFYQLVVTGIFLILAVYVDYIRNMRPSK